MRLVTAVLLSLGAAACGAAEAMPPPTAPAAKVATGPGAPHELGLYAGETMAFDVKLAGVLVGDAQLAVGQPGEIDGHHAIAVRSRVATAGAVALFKTISDEAVSTIDATTGKPIAVASEVHMGDHVITSKSRFTGSHADISFQRDGAEPRAMAIDFGTADLYDSHSAMAELRGWKAPTGTQRTVYVVGGRRLWRVDVTFVGQETVGTDLGNRPCVVFSGLAYRVKRDLTLESKSPARTFKVWLSDDADRVPVLVSATTELGAVEITLTEYQRP